MPNNLTGTNISDTYQKVVQVENGQLSDGTGSSLPLSFNSDGVTITGTLHANTISSSRVTSSIIYTSGSSTFGDQASDTHTFLGNITASGNISSSGTILANTYTVGGLSALSNFNGDLTIGIEEVDYDAYQLMWLTTREDQLKFASFNLRNDRIYLGNFYIFIYNK